MRAVLPSARGYRNLRNWPNCGADSLHAPDGSDRIWCGRWERSGPTDCQPTEIDWIAINAFR